MYMCRYDRNSPFVTCSAETDICPVLASGQPTTLEYEVDTSYVYYLNNWYVQMNLVCADKVKTNSMISMHYIVYGIAGLLMYTMADRSGRKTTMVRIFGLHIAAQYLMIFVPTYPARLAAFMLYGFT